MLGLGCVAYDVDALGAMYGVYIVLECFVCVVLNYTNSITGFFKCKFTLHTMLDVSVKLVVSTC